MEEILSAAKVINDEMRCRKRDRGCSFFTQLVWRPKREKKEAKKNELKEIFPFDLNKQSIRFVGEREKKQIQNRCEWKECFFDCVVTIDTNGAHTRPRLASVTQTTNLVFVVFYRKENNSNTRKLYIFHVFCLRSSEFAHEFHWEISFISFNQRKEKKSKCFVCLLFCCSFTAYEIEMHATSKVTKQRRENKTMEIESPKE